MRQRGAHFGLVGMSDFILGLLAFEKKKRLIYQNLNEKLSIKFIRKILSVPHSMPVSSLILSILNKLFSTPL